MNQRVKAIVEEARKLSPEERLELFDQLEIVFAGDEGDGTPEEVEAAWVEEINRRIDNAEHGQTSSIPHDEVMAELRKLVQRS
jgi:putative addiction module component (TIGR02574 family)